MNKTNHKILESLEQSIATLQFLNSEGLIDDYFPVGDSVTYGFDLAKLDVQVKEAVDFILDNLRDDAARYDPSVGVDNRHIRQALEGIGEWGETL
mgnify:FL=1